jgi:hypothetical protein
MYVPSISAMGVPFVWSKTAIKAWCVWRSLFSGKSDTSLQVSPADGRYAGIAPSSPFRSAKAAMRGGIDARPSLSSRCASASASTRASRSSSSSTSSCERRITTAS